MSSVEIKNKPMSDIKDKTYYAPMYKVLIHNDDKTPYDFVAREVCIGIFKLKEEEARKLTHEVHTTGLGLAGIFALEQAEFKCEQVTSLARGRNFPLKCTYEPV